MEAMQADVLVIGGGTGGTAAAIQAARRGARTFLVGEGPWLGGMLTAAGVCAPDGNELAAWQTGIWGAFVRALIDRQGGGVDWAWVSFFTYEPAIAAQIFADWVAALPNLHWIDGGPPREMLRAGDRILGARFAETTVTATITIDATELGDGLALAEIPCRWGWEWHQEFGEPSAPIAPSDLTDRYPVQAPTWVAYLQDFGPDQTAPEIPAPPNYDPSQFEGAWDGYGVEMFLNYGRIPGDRFMLNWPQCGNDYHQNLARLVDSPAKRQVFLNEARDYSQGFARFLQEHLGRRYGLATDLFPTAQIGGVAGGGGLALHPYFRESRRAIALSTVTEIDLLPIVNGRVAPLPRDPQTGDCTAIAIGNYPNDHHYPGWDISLAPKATRWGGRWTGTPFALPYGCLVPREVTGLLVCEKNIGVSHMANGSTRLQPIVLGLGQAAGMAAALCVEQHCLPHELPVRSLQDALINDPTAPAAIIPLFDTPPNHPQWGDRQYHYRDRPDTYPQDGNAGSPCPPAPTQPPQTLRGIFRRLEGDRYQLQVLSPAANPTDTSPESAVSWAIVTLHAAIDAQLQTVPDGAIVTVQGFLNPFGKWLRLTAIAFEDTSPDP